MRRGMGRRLMPALMPQWKGRGVARVRALMAVNIPTPCGQCGELVEVGEPWVVGHIEPRAIRPDLTWEPSNWRVEHRACSQHSIAGVKRLVKAKRAREAGVFRGATSSSGSLASATLPGTPGLAAASPGTAPALPEPSAGWAELDWASAIVDRWEREPSFSWPRLLTEPHPLAVGTHGWAAAEWIEARRANDSRVPAREKPLRGFQVLRLVVGLQHDADGTLVVGTRLESTPRQQGKSVGLAEEALWRTHAAEVFGEEQTVMHTAKDLAVAREVQREARLWAADRGLVVRGTHGAEEIETASGSRWMIRGRDSVYSYSAGFAIVDEAWGVDPRVVDDGLEPTLVEREGGQLLLISTAHRRASSLFPERRRAAIRAIFAPGRSSLAEWSAPPDGDPLDPVVWQIASAHWTDKRAAFLADKAGRPGWREQWLNVWPGLDDAPADLWLSRAQLAAGHQTKVNPTPGTVAQIAVEVSDTHRVWAVAASWRAADGRAVLVTEGGPGGLEAALTRVNAWVERLPGGRVWAHQSVSARIPPGFPAAVVNMKTTDAAAASALFRDLVLENGLRHTGGPLLDQVESVAVRTLDGRELIDQKRSTGPVCAVKAGAWSVWATVLAGVEAGAIY